MVHATGPNYRNAEEPLLPNPKRLNPHDSGPVIFDFEDGEAATRRLRPWAEIEEAAEITAALVEKLEAEHFCIGCGAEFRDLDELEEHEEVCY